MRASSVLLMLLLGCTTTFPAATQAASPSTADAPLRTLKPAEPGDALFTDGRFSEAATAYEHDIASEPGSAAPLASLARLRLYQHREHEAAALARQSLVVSPDNALAAQVLRTADSRRAAFAPDTYRIDRASTGGLADFVITDPLPVVQVRIAGQPAKFLIDTGAPDIALKPAFAKALGLSITDGDTGVFAGGRRARVARTTVPELEIAGVHLRNVPAAINPAELQLPGVETDGVIGTGLLMHFLATLDYCRGRLVLAPRREAADYERRAAASGANIVPMWLVGDHFVFARGKINRAEGLFSIDTGLAGSGLVATKATIDAADVTLDEDKAGTGQGGGGVVRFVPFHASATLGALTRNDVPGVYMPEGDPYGIFPFKVAGALSHGFFRESRLTFDFDTMKLVTERCSR